MANSILQHMQAPQTQPAQGFRSLEEARTFVQQQSQGRSPAEMTRYLMQHDPRFAQFYQDVNQFGLANVARKYGINLR